MIRHVRLQATTRLKRKWRKKWAVARAAVLRRAGGRCEVCRSCAAGLDVHHVVKRSQGGQDHPEHNLVALCRVCHDRTDAPYTQGRLSIVNVGLNLFLWGVLHAADKWSPKRVLWGGVIGRGPGAA